MNQLSIATQIANEFSRIIREWAANDLGEIIRLNDEEAHPGICHTHDFFDANEAMMDAFEECGVEVVLSDEPGNEESMALWAEAWGIAKDSKFTHISPRSTQ